MVAQGDGISREAIVETAVDLMTEHGLPAVTLRGIATRLGVSAPTLYWYISSKRELLDHVAEHLMRRCRTGVTDAPAPGQPWWRWLSDRSAVLYRAMVSVRDAPQVVAGNRPTVEHLGEHDTIIGELVAAGFEPGEALAVLLTLGGYIGGMALEAQAEAARAAEDVDDSDLAAAARDTDRYPNVAAAVGALPSASRFDYGLDLLIRGIRHRHAELTGGTPSTVPTEESR